jgi:predicted peroxiredoxin
MKKLIMLAFAGLIFASCNTNKNPGIENQSPSTLTSVVPKDGVFIHITEGYNDPHRVLMPLKMAYMMSMDKDVIVYMDIHAVELLSKGSKDMNFADFESCQTYLKKLVEKKVGVYACPTCLKIAGIDTSNLLDGIQVANKERFFDFTKGRIITLDY